MEIEYGAEVVGPNGEAVGTVDYVIRDSWTGEIKKFMVRRDQPGSEIMLSPEHVLEAGESRVRVNISADCP